MYSDAEEIYSFTGFNVSPFNVKVAQLKYLQHKYDEAISYCKTAI